MICIIRRDDMTVNYNRLWKKLIDLDMSKSQLREKAGITTNAIAKMGKMKMYLQRLFVKFVLHLIVKSKILWNWLKNENLNDRRNMCSRIA